MEEEDGLSLHMYLWCIFFPPCGLLKSSRELELLKYSFDIFPFHTFLLMQVVIGYPFT